LPKQTFSFVGEWLRHHMVSLVATGVDFATMIGVVELFHVSPVLGTVCGAAAGGVTSFTFGRIFTFRSRAEPISRQAFRYSLVSGASLGLNALGEHLILRVMPSHYVLGRAIVATTVNNVWNYPLQRYFVFVHRTSSKESLS
jgi:putative flippase GtrA